MREVETWKVSGLIWTGTWLHAKSTCHCCLLEVKFVRDVGQWQVLVDEKVVGHSLDRKAAMRFAKSRVPKDWPKEAA